MFKLALISHSQQDVPDWVCPALREAGIALAADCCADAEAVAALAGDADIVWTRGSNMAYGAEGWREVIQQALPRLTRCGAIIRSGSGTDNIPVDEATRRNILVVNTPEATAEPVAEVALALMLAVGRHIVRRALELRSGNWPDEPNETQSALAGKTVGLIGFGCIARQLSIYLSGFGTRTISFDPVVSAETMQEYDVAGVDLDTLLKTADYVSIHCPLNDATRHLIDARALKKMRETAILINTARGGVIDEQALIHALQQGEIAGAGLDVLHREPSEPDNPLLAMDNVVVTPHISAFSETIYQNLWRLSVEAAIDLAEGRWPRSYVNRVSPRWPLSERG